MVTKCCFYYDLKKGVIILGWLSIIGAIGSVSAGIRAIRKDLTEIGGFAIVEAAIEVCLGVLLVVGARKEKAAMLLVWLVIGMIEIIFLILGAIAFLALGIHILENVEDSSNDIKVAGILFIVVSVFFFIASPVQIYFWIVVNSFYKQIRGQAESGGGIA